MNAEQQEAYEWAINQSYPSVAARYAKVLAEYIKRNCSDPENKPLTLEQFRQMDGEPVWCVDSVGNVFCMLIDSENNLCVDVECNYWEFPGYGITDDFNDLRQGSWLAYARKPEQEVTNG